MRRLKSFLGFSIIALTLLGLNSCQDKDERLAYYLDGIWEGTVISGSGNYDATIEFVQEGFYDNYGYGYEWDTGWNHGNTTRTYFEWYVQNRNIYIHYQDMAHGEYVVMDYDRLPRSPAEGVMLSGAFYDDYSGDWLADFRLYKVRNHDNYYAKEGAFDKDAVIPE